MPFFTFASHLASRVVALIVVPFIIYCLAFKAHFMVLTNSGPGDAQMSSLFQSTLNGSDVGRGNPLEVAYGSRVTIKNMGYVSSMLRIACLSTVVVSSVRSYVALPFSHHQHHHTQNSTNHNQGGGLLHSHVQTYPEGSKQQQVM